MQERDEKNNKNFFAFFSLQTGNFWYSKGNTQRRVEHHDNATNGNL